MRDLAFERHVPHRPEQMFDLVADLAAYPRFIPNCSKMQVEQDRGTTEDIRFARMTIKFGPLTQSYTSRVKIDPETLTITAHAVDGPFSHLDSRWRFEPEGTGTCVRFAIDFKINNPLIAAVAEPAFAAKQDEILDAFVEEAQRRYG
jgi:coenzyme Q-binding protein COQ10